MKLFLCFVSTIAIASASTILAPLRTQFHSQDAFGQYAYGYSDGLSAKSEFKSFDGITRGAYDYVDAEGKVQSVSYTADALNGFRVAATNLPKEVKALPVVPAVPVSDTVEVAAAKMAHLAKFSEIKMRNEDMEKMPMMIMPEAPKPVEDTDEVKKAKKEHMEAFEKVMTRTVDPSWSERRLLPGGAVYAYSLANPIAWIPHNTQYELFKENEAVVKARAEHVAALNKIYGRTVLVI